jgi:hypothetical protein
MLTNTPVHGPSSRARGMTSFARAGELPISKANYYKYFHTVAQYVWETLTRMNKVFKIESVPDPNLLPHNARNAAPCSWLGVPHPSIPPLPCWDCDDCQQNTAGIFASSS